MSEFREDFSVIEENQLIPAEMEQNGETEEQDNIRLKSYDLDDVREDEELDITGEEDEELLNISEVNDKKYNMPEQEETVTANAKNAKSPRHLLVDKKEISPRSRSHVFLGEKSRIRSDLNLSEKIFSLRGR